ncbi:response regulator [Niallia circulans]
MRKNNCRHCFNGYSYANYGWDGSDEKIRQQFPHIKILILTTFNDEDYAIKVFQEGANGFLLKTTDNTTLVNSIKSCLAGGMSIHDQVAAKLMPKLLKKRTCLRKN